MEHTVAEEYAAIDDDLIEDPLKREDFIDIFDENYYRFDFWDVEDLINDIYNKLEVSPLDESDEQLDEPDIEYDNENYTGTPYELKVIEDEEDDQQQDYLTNTEDDFLNLPDSTEEEEPLENELLEEVLDKQENEEETKMPETSPETEDIVKQLLIQVLF